MATSTPPSVMSRVSCAPVTGRRRVGGPPALGFNENLAVSFVPRTSAAVVVIVGARRRRGRSVSRRGLSLRRGRGGWRHGAVTHVTQIEQRGSVACAGRRGARRLQVGEQVPDRDGDEHVVGLRSVRDDLRAREGHRLRGQVHRDGHDGGLAVVRREHGVPIRGSDPGQSVPAPAALLCDRIDGRTADAPAQTGNSMPTATGARRDWYTPHPRTSLGFFGPCVVMPCASPTRLTRHTQGATRNRWSGGFATGSPPGKRPDTASGSGHPLILMVTFGGRTLWSASIPPITRIPPSARADHSDRPRDARYVVMRTRWSSG